MFKYRLKKYLSKDILKFKINLFNNLKKHSENDLKPINKLKYDGKIYNNLYNNITFLEFFKRNNLFNENFVFLKIINKDGIIKSINFNDNLEDNIEIIDIIDNNSIEGLKTIWHSGAHILGSILENKYNLLLMNGPSTNNGFYYGFKLNNYSEINLKDLEISLNNKLNKDINFENLVVKKEDAKKLFYNNPYKLSILDKTNEEIRIFKCGDFIDLCKGPHIYNSKLIKDIKLRNFDNQDGIGKIYGYSNKIEDDKNNHRFIGEQQKLFRFEESSPGSPYFLPKGTHIISKIFQILRKEYKIRGFKEVITPLMVKKDLWKTSGHLQNYEKNMYFIGDFGLKPMNCPCHCLIFKSEIRNHDDLPLKYADFSILHRNEASGALTGLTRVRKFQQDDSHIFCRLDQIKEVIWQEIEFINYIYNIFQLDFEIEISTKPEKYIGSNDQWELSEKVLKECLNLKNNKFKINEGDGAFYGPKIDFKIKDNNNKEHQLSTIQIDFNLPKLFNLKYKNLDSFEVPVIIHRAILGSFERFFAILIEKYKGRWPLFLNPNQIILINVNPKFNEYSKSIKDKLISNEFEVHQDNSNFSFNKKIRNAQINQYNYIIIIGDKEFNNNIISVRNRDTNKTIEYTLDEFINIIKFESKIN